MGLGLPQSLERKHEVARNVIRVWVAKYQVSEFAPVAARGQTY
jgi:hypothetical protein